MTITTLTEYRCSLISRHDLFCNRKYIVATTFETSVQRVFNASCDFLSCLIKRFSFSLAELKTGCSKIGSIFLSIFSVLLKIKHGHAEMNIPVDFVLNKNDGRREKNDDTRETSWKRRSRSETCCTHEKEKRRDIAQQRIIYSTIYRAIYRTIYSTIYSTIYRIEFSTIYSTEFSTVK